jgi:SAM-dependent methyltransferase
MLHVAQAARAPSWNADLSAAALEHQAAQQRLIRQSNTTPYRQVAQVLAALYCSAIALAAGVVEVVARPAPTRVHRRLAELYWAVPEMALHKAIELEAFLRHRFQGRGLDLGCGNGLVGGILIREAVLTDLHGVDQSAACRESVLSNGYAAFAARDIQALGCPDRQFDYAISICVIEHVPDLGRALDEVARALRPGGRFVFSTPAPTFRDSTLGYRLLAGLGFRRQAEAFQRHKDLSAMQFHYLTPEAWREALGRAGFEDVDVRGIFSRRQLLVYDAMNIQVNCLRLYFADKLAIMLARHPRLRRLMVAVTEILVSYFAAEHPPRVEEATHFLIACTRKRTAEHRPLPIA